MNELFLISMFIGAIAGILAGLFGLGGGVVIVPALVWLFTDQQFPAQLIMIMAVATSMATIIVTSSSSIISHQLLGTILWSRVARLIPGILVGAGVGAFCADSLTGDMLKWFFICYLLYVGMRMAVNVRFKKIEKKVKQKVLWLDYWVGIGIGLISALLGIGGGTLTVPYLVGRQVPMKNAVAISCVCGLPIAISATVAYIYLGWQKAFLPAWSLGYIYLPAVCGITVCSILTAPLGAKLAYKLPAIKLKRYFSIVLFLIALKMIAE